MKTLLDLCPRCLEPQDLSGCSIPHCLTTTVLFEKSLLVSSGGQVPWVMTSSLAHP